MNSISKSINIWVAVVLGITILFSSVPPSFAAPVEYGTEISNSPVKSYEQIFTDVPKDFWAFDYISELVEHNVLSGYPDGLFRPNNIVSRAEFAKIMIAAAGIDVNQAQFTGSVFYADMSNHWANAFVNASKDYLTGYVNDNGNSYFKPDAPALREDIAVAMVKLKGYDINLADLSMIQKMFTDYDGISDQLKPYVAVAIEKGIMSGYPDGTFRAQNAVSRAEAATLLWRAYQYGNANKVVGNSDTTPSPSAGNSTAATASQNQVSSKYSVYTLAGGNGKGITDGNAANSAITDISSIIVDKYNSILFVDDQTKIRKFDGTTVKTRYDTNTDFPYQSENKREQYTLSDAVLCHDKARNKTYVLGNQTSNMNKFTALYDISSSTVSASVYDEDEMFSLLNGISIDFLSDGSLLGTSAASIDGNDSPVFKIKPGVSIGTFHKNHLGNSCIMVWNNDIYTFHSHLGLYKYNFSKGQFERVQTDQDYAIEDNHYITTYNGKFYFSIGQSIYQMDTEGNSELFIDPDDMNIQDLLPLRKIRNLTFDNNGNIIFFDPDNYALRIIKKN